MDEAEITPEVAHKKTTRRKTPTKVVSELVSSSTPSESSIQASSFSSLINQITELQLTFNNLQKQIEEIKQNWLEEQEDHDLEMATRNTQDEVERKRMQEGFEYEMARKQKVAEDDFNDKRAAWEKQLRDSQDQIARDKQEFEDLRKLAADFDGEKELAVKEALNQLEKQLTDKYESETRFKEQEFKAAKEMLNLKVTNLQTETDKQKIEIESLRKALDEATRQVKEIAVKVIESGNSTTRTLTTET